MEHYRLYKLDDQGKRIVKAKDLHAADDAHAMHQACEDPECPVCELWRGSKKIGSID